MDDKFFIVTLEDGEVVRNITDRIQEMVDEWSLERGHIYVFEEHTTCAMLIQECEPCLICGDLFECLEHIAPVSIKNTDPGEPGYYRHDDLRIRKENLETGGEERVNGHAHLRASLCSPFIVLRVRDYKLHLGKWQRILFFDFDDLGERRDRTISVSVM